MVVAGVLEGDRRTSALEKHERAKTPYIGLKSELGTMYVAARASVDGMGENSAELADDK